MQRKTTKFEPHEFVILIVWQKPSPNPNGPNALVNSVSYNRYMTWMRKMRLGDFTIQHISATQDPKPEKIWFKDIDLQALKATIKGIGPDITIAMGNETRKVLKKLKLPFLCLPHPSTRNLSLNPNNKDKLDKQLQYVSKAVFSRYYEVKTTREALKKHLTKTPYFE